MVVESVAIKMVALVVRRGTGFIPRREHEGVTVLRAALTHDLVVRPSSAVTRGCVGSVVRLDLIEGPFVDAGDGVT